MKHDLKLNKLTFSTVLNKEHNIHKENKHSEMNSMMLELKLMILNQENLSKLLLMT